MKIISTATSILSQLPTKCSYEKLPVFLFALLLALSNTVRSILQAMDFAEILNDSADRPSFEGLATLTSRFDHEVFANKFLLTYFMLIQVIYSLSYMHSRSIHSLFPLK